MTTQPSQSSAGLTTDLRKLLSGGWCLCSSAHIDWNGVESLLDRLESAEARLAAVEALAEQWNSTPDYAPSDYDQGRVDQRHDMTTQLLEALTAAEPAPVSGAGEVGSDG